MQRLLQSNGKNFNVVKEGKKGGGGGGLGATLTGCINKMHPSSCILLLNGETLNNVNVIVYTSLKKETDQMGLGGPQGTNFFQTTHYGGEMSPTQQIVEILFCILLEFCRYNFALNLSSVILLSDPKNRNIEPLIS